MIKTVLAKRTSGDYFTVDKVICQKCGISIDTKTNRVFTVASIKRNSCSILTKEECVLQYVDYCFTCFQPVHDFFNLF